MPTYEYVCRGCDEHVEVVQSFKDDPLTTCGLCSGQLRKVFSAAGIIFKGSGYYVTDTREERSKTASKGKAKAEGEAKSTTGDASESTTGGKSESTTSGSEGSSTGTAAESA
jgi:putative FmdB family regulatory protein